MAGPRLAAIGLGLLVALAPRARADIAHTLHNFTPTGPGDFVNPNAVGLCRYCHTPHRAGQTVALWNRNLSTQIYDLYESSTLEAELTQPTGASRLCLSCHDGTIALDQILESGPDAVGPLGPVQGRVRLGTDLSDDHPISFVFDESLAARNGELVSPLSLTGAVGLDHSGQVQCTSCHDPHQDRFPKFLVMDNEGSALCVTCHLKRGWTSSSHANSPATWNGLGEDPWPESSLDSVAQNGCLSCHDPHSAARPERLLRQPLLEQVCLVCHGGNVAQTDVQRQIRKPSHHPVEETSESHDPRESPLSMPRHAACPDCHNPHAVAAGEAEPPDLPPTQRFARGLDLSGVPLEEARFAYEVCLRCHGVSEASSPVVVRADHVTNVRLEVHSSNPSYHPVTAIGTNPNVQSLISPLGPTSRIYCHDCHSSDEAPLGDLSVPIGPHGSEITPILEREYPLVDFVEESEAAFALCFKCHDEERLFDDSAFEHKKHVRGENAPCAACHDPHGSRTSTHLINFLRFDRSGAEVVRPSQNTGRMEYNDLGFERGECFLNCHGEEHDPKRYIGNDKDD